MRFPLQEQIPLIAGLLLTGAWSHYMSLSVGSVLVSALGLTLFFWIARLQIDIRDYLQDTHRTINQKPLARSMLRLNDLKSLRWFSWVALLTYGILLAIFDYSTAGYSLIAICVWLVLASKNYFLRFILSEHPFIHSILDHAVLFGVTLFSVGAFLPAMIDWNKIIGIGGIYGLTLMNRELVKNLDPHSHSILRNYHSLIGAERTWVAMLINSTVMIILAAQVNWWIPIAATQMGFHLFFAFLYLRPKRWDLIARFSYWIFIIYAWITPVSYWMNHRS